MSSISFQDVKSTLQNNFISLGCSSAAVNQLLTDDFINGIIAICEQNQNQYNGEILACVENLNNSPNLSTGKIFHDTFYIEAKKDGIVKDIIEYLNKNIDISLSETPTPALLSPQNINENTSTLNTGNEITIGKGAIIVLGTLSIMALVAGGPAGFATFMLATVYIGGIFFEFDENGNLRYKEDDYLKNIDNYMSTARETRSPLVVDLDGDGVETTTLDNGVHFDHDGNGFAEKTAWVGKDDGLLVRDINGNGQIDDGSELFGNNTILSNGQKAANGFEALKDLDSNGDGIFDSRDSAWNEVKVWKDSNQNGFVEDGELLTLEQAGISGINLGYENSDSEDENGNTIGQTGSFIKADSTIGSVSDVWFETNQSNSVDKIDVEIPEDIQVLPEVSAFGNVHNLQIAMALDETGALKSLVEQFVAETDVSVRDGLLNEIIYHWAGVQDMDPRGRDPQHTYGPVLDDCRKLEALEEFVGEDFVGTWCWDEKDPNPHALAAPYILQAFDLLKQYLNFELLSQTHYKNLLENVKLTWNAETEVWDVDVSGAITILQNLYNADSENGMNILKEFSGLIHSYEEFEQDVISAFEAAGNPEGSDFEQALFRIEGLYNRGTAGDDVITGTDENDSLNGGAGNDRIYGGAGDDELIGGTGDDYLNGGKGNDIYRFEVGFGNDSVDNTGSEDNNADKIVFGEGIEASRTSLERQGYDLVIRVSYEDETKEDDTVRVFSYFDKQGTTSATVSKIVFADGTEWDYEYVRNNWDERVGINGGMTLVGNDERNLFFGTDADDIIIGNGGDDEVYGNGGNDVIIGGKGNDYLEGGYGSDSYIWNWGDDLDTINEYDGHDKIVFGQGIKLSDLTFRCDGGNLKIIVKGDESQGMIINKFFGGDISRKIKDLCFADGSIYHLSEESLYLQQKDEAEDIRTDYTGYTINAGGGDDFVYAGEGDDVIIGGKGDDYLEGGYGDDTYIYNIGDGFDTIREYNRLEVAPAENKIIFGAGITYSDVTFRRDGVDLLLVLFNDDTQGMRLKNFFRGSSNQVKELKFADGSVYNIAENGMTLQQTDIDDVVTGTGYDDIIYGNGGNDTIYGGDGNDVIIGGKGDDYLEGGYGDDTYIYNLGDGFDTIREYNYSDISPAENKIIFGSGITYSDVTFRRDGVDLLLVLFNDDTQGMRLKNFFRGSSNQVKELKFADGSVYNIAETGLTLQQTDIDDVVTGTGYDDIIYGNGGNDTIYGGDGNDVIIGGKGDDYLEGGYGDDTYIYNLGDGFDTIVEGAPNGFSDLNDKIVFGEGISREDLTFSIDGRDLTILISGDETQGIKIQNQFQEFCQVEYIEFSNGDSMSISGADQLIQAMNSFSLSTSASTDALSNPTENVAEMYNLAVNNDLSKQAA